MDQIQNSKAFLFFYLIRMILHSSNNEDYICFLSAKLNFATAVIQKTCVSYKNMELYLNDLFN